MPWNYTSRTMNISSAVPTEIPLLDSVAYIDLFAPKASSPLGQTALVDAAKVPYALRPTIVRQSAITSFTK